MNPDPHGLAEQVGWDGVLPAVEGHHRGLGRDSAGDPERDSAVTAASVGGC